MPELPAILVTGDTVDELMSRAVGAIQIYWENLEIDRTPTSQIRQIEVELTA